MGSHAAFAEALLWFLVFIYALAGSVDFGATFWKMVFARQGTEEAAEVAASYVSPLWEATNVFLVLIAVVLVGFFPKAAFVYGTVLLIPGSLLLLLMALRGAFLSYGYAYAKATAFHRYVTGLTALVIPALLVAVLPISDGGYVRHVMDTYRLDLHSLLSSPKVYAYILFGLTAELFISATFLSDYAWTKGDRTAYRLFRVAASGAGPAMIIAGLTALFLLPSPAWLAGRLQAQWPLWVASLIFMTLSMFALWWPRSDGSPSGYPRLAVVMMGLQFAFAHLGYGRAHAPYLLYPYITPQEAFTNEVMFRGVLITLVLSMAIVVPAFVWLWRLFIAGPRPRGGAV
ncbi:MAG: cytochrome d ubiquinol oxidase subunit II [Firmicutes bacterium]|nr:cytochrome d ubiquinol oxidase subunit II [Bacillota bacterium]